MEHKRNNEVKKERTGYLGASDIVNGSPSMYEIREEEMESALRNIMKEIDEMS